MHGFYSYFSALCTENVTEKKRHPTRTSCDGVLNLRRQILCVNRKGTASQVKRLERSSGKSEAEVYSKSL
ncbi:hypothetical protein TNCV_998961 [Trichonephila clavipes]|nr:hypothetical protein TNCV_998961 [Trichonephila clavipes]